MSLDLDAQVIDEQAELIPAPAAPANLFRTDDPAEVLKRAQSTADALMPVVREKSLIANIQGKEHLTVEAWQTLGAMLGVTPVCVWTRALEDGWEARVEARTLDGRVIGAAEAECLRAESTWKSRDDYALRSMAQTRATSKALASVLRFVATLAGVQGTPAEEMPRDGGSNIKQPDAPATGPQKGKVTYELNQHIPPEYHDQIREAFKADTKGGASALIEELVKGNAMVAYRKADITPPSDVPVDTAGLDADPGPEDGTLDLRTDDGE